MNWLAVCLKAAAVLGALVWTADPGGLDEAQRRRLQVMLNSRQPAIRAAAERELRQYAAAAAEAAKNRFELIDESGAVRAVLQLDEEGNGKWTILDDPMGRLAKVLEPQVKVVETTIIKRESVPVVRAVPIPIVHRRVVPVPTSQAVEPPGWRWRDRQADWDQQQMKWKIDDLQTDMKSPKLTLSP